MPSVTLSPSQIVSVASGRLLCTLAELYDACSSLAGRDVYTHELPTVMRLWSEPLKAAFPEICAAQPPVFPERPEAEVVSEAREAHARACSKIAQTWSRALARLHGKSVEVDLGWAPSFADTDQGPLASLLEMMGTRPAERVRTIEEAAQDHPADVRRSIPERVSIVLSASEAPKFGLSPGERLPAMRWIEYDTRVMREPYLVLCVGDEDGNYCGTVIRDLPKD